MQRKGQDPVSSKSVSRMPATDDEIREKYLERAIRELNRLTHDLQVPGFQERQEGFAEAGVVVHDENPDRPTVPDRAGKDRRFHVRQVSGGVRPGAIRRAWVS